MAAHFNQPGFVDLIRKFGFTSEHVVAAAKEQPRP
jgi:hypothetical protein